MTDFQEIRRIAWATIAELLGITEPTASLTGASSAKYLAGDGTWKTTPTGTVTSVAQTFTGGLISVGGSPITTSGTLALTVAGTSGGGVYFSSASTWASTGALTANALMIGGGAGTAYSTTTTGTGVVTALGVNVGSAGAFVTFNGALGTPSSGTLTSATGLPVSTGISGFGTGVATALAVNVGSAGAFVTLNGALGTPSSGVATNLTGTAASLTAGTVTTNANLTGDVTSVGNATTLTNAPVIAKVLTGYASGAGTVAATDSILQAIQKLNGNDATNANLTGVITSVGNATSIASQTGTGTKFVTDTAPTFASTIKVTTGASVGGATPGTGGVAFPATQVAVADANTLDDYEEGTWSPTLSSASTTTYTTQSGRYTKIGRRVFFDCLLTINSAGDGDQTSIGSLPFTVAATSMGGVTVGDCSGLATAIVWVSGYPVGGGTRIQLGSLTAAGTALGGSNLLGNGASVKVSGSYDT